MTTRTHDIAEAIIDAQAIAMGIGLDAKVCRLGPVKYAQWRSWVNRNMALVIPSWVNTPPDCETFNGMAIMRGCNPGIEVGEE